jgi:hypothetical protein
MAATSVSKATILSIIFYEYKNKIIDIFGEKSICFFNKIIISSYKLNVFF